MTDATVRLVNLQSAGLNVVERLAATDVAAVEADRRLRIVSSPALGYQILSFNLARGEQAATPFGRDTRVQEAFEKALNHEALNQMVLDGRYVPRNQTEAPRSRYRDAARPAPARDVAGTKALLTVVGLNWVKLSLFVGNDAVADPTRRRDGDRCD